MNIHVLGFEPIVSDLPSSFSRAAGFVWLRGNAGVKLNKFLTTAVIDCDGWHAGVVLKARDAETFTKMMKVGTVNKVMTERLPDGQSLVEVNFFVAHPSTGRGLYAYHYRSASLTSDFAWVCAKSFNYARTEAMDTALEAPGLGPKEKAAVRKEYNGRFVLSQLLNKSNLKDFLTHLRSVSSFEASFTSFDLEEDVFDPISKQARRKTVKFQFPPGLSIAHIEGDLEKAAASSELEDFWVEGRDRANRAAEFHKKKNALVFAEYNYDELLGDVSIAFDDWKTSIESAEMTKKLLAIANSPRVRRVLEAP